MSLLRDVLKNLIKRPFTKRYPKEKTEPFERFRGSLVYHPKKCIGCKQCVINCPSNAIKFFRKGKIDFDLGKCITCGLCVELCPTKAITWSRNFELANKNRKKIIVR